MTKLRSDGLFIFIATIYLVFVTTQCRSEHQFNKTCQSLLDTPAKYWLPTDQLFSTLSDLRQQ